MNLGTEVRTVEVPEPEPLFAPAQPAQAPAAVPERERVPA
jgi:hypothetical protein